MGENGVGTVGPRFEVESSFLAGRPVSAMTVQTSVSELRVGVLPLSRADSGAETDQSCDQDGSDE